MRSCRQQAGVEISRRTMPEVNEISPFGGGKPVAEVVQAYIDDLRHRFPSAAYLLEEPGYGDEDVVVRIYGYAR